MSAIVIDVGGTHIRCAVADQNAALFNVQKKSISSFVAERSSDRVWKEIVDIIVEYERVFKNAVPIEAPLVISFPGPVEFPSRILSAPTLIGKDSFMPDFHHQITRYTGRATHIINDMSAAAWRLGQSIKDDRFLVVTVSSGIGGKVFDRLHPHRVLDEKPFAGEIGHVKIDMSDDAMPCDCGGKGHLGAVASGRGIERLARREARRERGRFVDSACAKKFQGTADTITNEEHIVPAALMGDGWALDIVRRGTRPLAASLLLATAALALDRIVVIGGFALSLGPVYLDILRSEMLNQCDYSILAEKVPGLVILGDADEEACLRGAAAYALNIKARSGR